MLSFQRTLLCVFFIIGVAVSKPVSTDFIWYISQMYEAIKAMSCGQYSKPLSCHLSLQTQVDGGSESESSDSVSEEEAENSLEPPQVVVVAAAVMLLWPLGPNRCPSRRWWRAVDSLLPRRYQRKTPAGLHRWNGVKVKMMRWRRGGTEKCWLRVNWRSWCSRSSPPPRWKSVEISLTWTVAFCTEFRWSIAFP